MLFSIEKLENATASSIKQGEEASSGLEWLVVELADQSNDGTCLPRVLPSVAFLNVNEICIMGGQGNEGLLGDVILFDTQTEEVRTAVGNFAGLLQFCGTGHGQNCTMFQDNVAIALVQNVTQGKSYLIQYTKGQSILKVINQFQ